MTGADPALQPSDLPLDGVCLVDPTGKLLSMDRKMARLAEQVGLTPSEIELTDLPGQEGQFQSFLNLCIRSGTPLPGRIGVTTPTSKIIPFRVRGRRARPVEASSEGLIHLRLVADNHISRRLGALNQKIHELNSEIRRRRILEHELEEALDREREAREEAEEASRLKDEFLAAVSHELRTPLNVIMGWTEILLNPDLAPGRQDRGLRSIDRAARAQHQAVEDLLDFSRLAKGTLALELKPVEVERLVSETVEDVLPGFEAASIELMVDVAPDMPRMRADPERVRQILWNLLSNALKFSRDGGTVTLRATGEDGNVALRVHDDGRGIEPAFLPRLFEPFTQQDGSLTKRAYGMGLGLALVKRLAELHGGSVDVSSGGRGKGSTFVVRLPSEEPNGAPSTAG